MFNKNKEDFFLMSIIRHTKLFACLLFCLYTASICNKNAQKVKNFDFLPKNAKYLPNIETCQGTAALGSTFALSNSQTKPHKQKTGFNR